MKEAKLNKKKFIKVKALLYYWDIGFHGVVLIDAKTFDKDEAMKIAKKRGCFPKTKWVKIFQEI